MRGSFSVAMAVAFAVSAFAPPATAQLNVKIVESQSGGQTHQMDAVWQNVATAMGFQASIHPQTLLDSAAFVFDTDVLIVSSGTIGLTPYRVAIISAFLGNGGSVYIQGEYHWSFDANLAFSTIVGNHGGSFDWSPNPQLNSLAPMAVSGPLATTPNLVPVLGQFLGGAHGTGDATVTPFLTHAGLDYGWLFQTSALPGSMIATTDQEWINSQASDPLMENILTELAAKKNPCAPSYGAGCPGAGGIVPTLTVDGCTTAGSQISVTIAAGLGGSSALILMGAGQAALPIGGGCTLNLSPLIPIVVGPLPLGGAVAGQGSLTLPAVIPSGAPAGSLTIQAFVADAANAAGFSNTNGVDMIFP